MHIPPGSGKASAVFKLQYSATGMKSKRKVRGVGSVRESREGGQKGDKAQLV